MDKANPVSTPLDPNEKLIALKDDDFNNKCTEVPYREAVECLMYLIFCTRPDICIAVSKVYRFLSNPSKQLLNEFSDIFVVLLIMV